MDHISPFIFWCQKVMPAVLDDSLSYYECLCKVTAKLNETITSQNTLIDAQQALQKYVDDYFTNLDVQEEINKKLDEMAEDGTLSALFEPFISADITDWLEKNVDPVGSAVVVDKSLTVSGAAADAKVVGDNIKSKINSYDWLSFTGQQVGTVQTTYENPVNKINTTAGYSTAFISEIYRSVKCVNNVTDKEIIIYFKCSNNVTNIYLSYGYNNNPKKSTMVNLTVNATKGYITVPKGTQVLNPVEGVNLNYIFFKTNLNSDLTAMFMFDDEFYKYTKTEANRENNNSRISSFDAIEFDYINTPSGTTTFDNPLRQVTVDFSGNSYLHIYNSQIHCENGVTDKDIFIYTDTPNNVTSVTLSNGPSINSGVYVTVPVSIIGKQTIHIPKGTAVSNPQNVPLNYIWIPGNMDGTISAYYSNFVSTFYNYNNNGDFDWIPLWGYRNTEETINTNSKFIEVINAQSITAFIMASDYAPECKDGTLSNDIYVYGYSSKTVRNVILSYRYDYTNNATSITIPINKSGNFIAHFEKGTAVNKPKNTKLPYVFFMTSQRNVDVSAEITKRNYIYDSIVSANPAPSFGLVSWGDSLTVGNGTTGTNYPEVLANLLGVTYFNAGANGDTSFEIATRAGSNNIVLPVGAVNTYTTLTDVYGNTQRPLKYSEANYTTNPIKINNIECTLSKTDSGYSISGYSDNLIAPTLVEFSGTTIKGNITTIFCGTNDVDVPVEERIRYIDAIISNTNGKVLVLGVMKGTTASQTADEEALLEKYGNKFFNTRVMMSQYGMEVAGLNPTPEDKAAIAEGSVPPSLRVDSLHLTATGYETLGKLLYSHVIALGY